VDCVGPIRDCSPGGEVLTEVTIAGGAATFRDYIYAGTKLIAVVTR